MSAIASVTYNNGKFKGVLVGFVQHTNGVYKAVGDIVHSTVAGETYGIVVVDRQFVEIKLNQLTFCDWRD